MLEGCGLKGIRERIGTVVDAAESAYPLDLSRLRLFAEAVGDCLPHQFDPAAGRQSEYGCVVAPPLFPIHAIELPPGSRTSVDIGYEVPGADGRRFAVLVDSIGSAPAPLAVERATYWNVRGVRWAAGTNAPATRLR